jgi:hypothetical protein
MARLSRGFGVGLSGGFLVGFSPVAVLGLWNRGVGGGCWWGSIRR